jgi:hypothetical protein
MVLLPALERGGRRQLRWLKSTGALLATYEDSCGGEYTSTCADNRNRVVEGNRHPNLRPARFPWQMPKNEIGSLAGRHN